MRSSEIANLTASQVHLNVHHISGIVIVDYIDLGEFDRPAPRKPRPGGRGQGELYKNGLLPFREAPRGSAGRLHTKNGIRRTVPVSPRLKEVLERRLDSLEPEGYVFGDKLGKYINTRISNKFIHLCKRAKVQHGDNLLNKKGQKISVVFHCLRHGRVTKWVEMGYSDEIIRRASGHKSLAVYQQYIKLDPSAVMPLVGDQNPKRHKNDTKIPQTQAGWGF